MIKKYNKEEFDNSTNKIIIFSSNTCGACKMVKPSLEKIAEESGVDLFEANIMLNADLASEMGVTTLPTIQFYKGDEIVKETYGFIPEPEIRNNIKKMKGDN